MEQLQTEKQSKIAKNTLILIIISLTGYFFSLITQIFLGKFFGANTDLDAFIVSLIIPTTIYGLTAPIFFTAIILKFSEIKKENEFNKAISSFFLFVIGISFILSLFEFLLAPILVKIIAGGLVAHSFQISIDLVRINAIYCFFLCLSIYTTAILHLKKSFFIPAILQPLINIGTLITLLLFNNHLNVYYLSFSLAASSCFAWLLQFCKLKKEGILIFSSWKLPVELIKQIVFISLPILFYDIFYYLNKNMGIFFASFFSEGSITIFNYAVLILNAPVLLLSGNLGTVLFPTLTQHQISNDKEKVGALISKALALLLYVFVPLSILIGIYGSDVITILFQHGKFTLDVIVKINNAVFYYNFGLIAYAVYALFSTILYSMKKVKTQLVLMIILFLLDIVFITIFIRIIGFNGIFLGFALSCWILCGVCFFIIQKNVSLNKALLKKKIIKLMTLSLLLLCVSLIVKEIITPFFSKGYTLYIMLVVGAILLNICVYIFFSWVFKIEEFLYIQYKLKEVITHDRIK